MDDDMRHRLDEHFEGKPHEDFGRKAWMQSDRNSSRWITTCPKEHIALNAKQFPVVAQTYFGVAQQCLMGLEGQPIIQKSGRMSKQSREVGCDVYGENLVKTILRGGGWTYHHSGINLQL